MARQPPPSRGSAPKATARKATARKTATRKTDPSRRRGPSKGDLKEAAILDTAWQLLTEKPLTAITIDDLARGAGISRSSFYFYFDSKDAVLRALSSRVADEIRGATGPSFDPDVIATDDQVRASIAGYLHRWREKGPMLRAMAVMSEQDEELRAFWAGVTGELLDRFADGIERARSAGAVPPGPPAARDLARVIVAMLWRVGYELSIDQPSPAEERRIVDTVATVCLRAVGVPATPG
jgi:TetR/AcrR family transcriptional regulator, ethionamide resistance regulator